MSFRNRLCLVTDIVKYSQHAVPAHADAQRRLLKVMTFACRQAGVSRVRARDRQDRGDGRLYVLPPRLDETLVIPRLILGLRHGLYLANREPGGFGRIQLRAAMARGSIANGKTGFVGQAPITVCRLVDSTPVRDGLTASTSADLALIVTDELYQDVIKMDYPDVPCSEFTSVDVSAKEYSGAGWVYVPAPGPALPAEDSEATWAALSLAAGAGAGVILVNPLTEGPDADIPDDSYADTDLSDWDAEPEDDSQGPSDDDHDDDDHDHDDDDLDDLWV